MIKGPLCRVHWKDHKNETVAEDLKDIFTLAVLERSIYFYLVYYILKYIVSGILYCCKLSRSGVWKIWETTSTGAAVATILYMGLFKIQDASYIGCIR